jgi:two-component system sensor histidine kinase ChiS
MIACQSIALSQRFARSFASVEALSTELAEKNVALSRVDNLKDQFLANTSHELRTPLNGIIGIADSLLAGVTGQLPDETRHNLAMIAASGRHLGALINDILDSSRLRNRDIRLRREPVDLHALAETVLAVMQPLAQGKPIALTNRDGWERTQTLDRYLDIGTFPLRPAWAKIMKTAEFVLATGTGDSVLRSRLEILLARLRVSR